MFTDTPSLEAFVNIQSQLNPTMSIEVGAYDADFSKAVISTIGNCYAFEASRHVYDKFKSDMGDIKYINKAVSNHDGVIQFNIDTSKNPSEIGHNSIKLTTDLVPRETTSEKIECISLDSYFGDLKDQNICMWIDAEGANREVLLGAENTLKMVSSIYIEVEHAELWHMTWLKDDVVKYLNDQGFILFREDENYQFQSNCIFIRS